MDRDGTKQMLVLMGVFAAVAIPVVATLSTARAAPGVMPISENPTPYGYTVSLLLFVVPGLSVAIWQLLDPDHPVDRKALLWAGVLTAVGGFVLDFLFAYSFFEFPNPHAVMGIYLPGLAFCMPGSDPCAVGVVPGYIPLEDAIFYVSGAMFVITVYLWLGKYWFSRYEVEDRSMKASEVKRLLSFSPGLFAATVVLVILGIVAKRLLSPEYPDALPGYYLFILATGLLPAMVLFRVIKDFVNWRAFGGAFAILTFISLVWEVTMALPYGWWNYKPEYMMGIRVTAWFDIPFEAVFLWLVASWLGVMIYEFLRVYLHMDRGPKKALLG